MTIMKMTIIDIGRIGERRFAYNITTKEILSRRTKINPKMIRIILPSAPLMGYLLYSYIKIPVPDSPLKCLIVTTITLCITVFIMICLIMRVSEHIVNVKRFDILGTIEDLSNKNVEKLKKIEGENLVIGTLIFLGIVILPIFFLSGYYFLHLLDMQLWLIYIISLFIVNYIFYGCWYMFRKKNLRKDILKKLSTKNFNLV